MLAQDTKAISPDLPVVDLSRARAFYEEKLGFKPIYSSDDDVMYQIGETGGLYLYLRPEPTKAEHTEVSFVVDDVEKEVSEMREMGISFEEYDLPEFGIKTVNGIATMDGMKAAWFKDTEGNILNIGEYEKMMPKP